MSGKDGRGKGGVGMSGCVGGAAGVEASRWQEPGAQLLGWGREAAAGRAFAWDKAPGELHTGWSFCCGFSPHRAPDTVLPTRLLCAGQLPF